MGAAKPPVKFVVPPKPAPKPVAKKPINDDDDDDEPKGGLFGLFGGAKK